jgi:hypothetical protein
MAWIKRNLFFVIGGILALALLGAAGYYNYREWRRNSAAYDTLKQYYDTLRSLITTPKISPGNDKVDNIAAAREQERQVRDWIRQASEYFQPIAPIPAPVNGTVTSAAFAAALRRTIDQLQHEAEVASVALPPRYYFTFEAERPLVRFAPGSLGSLAVQFGEVKAIAEVLFAARVNSLDGIQRTRVSEDDMNGPQSDYFEEYSVTNNLAILTPYQVTFRSFTPEIAHVLAGFAASPHGFVVKSINVQPAGAAASPSPSPGPMGPPFMPPPPMPRPESGKVETVIPLLAVNDAEGPILGQGYTPPGVRRQFAPPTTPPPVTPVAPPPVTPGMTPGRGGLQTVLNEQLLRVTLVVEVVKLLPKK